ncbi:MAG: pantoate--beta-alanine ligase [Flavobacteriaceae bacterium]|nr:MAG: pantoate--beta-alanine ligase [Flavobacteriaceae bacterium]
MLVYAKIDSLQEKLTSFKSNISIGFVPTMGALHQGHLSLIEEAKKYNDIVVVSVFVNPTQFDKKEDLDNYPITMDSDLRMLEEIGCDIVFTPTANEMYEDGLKSEHFDFGGIEYEMEGAFREGHFDGVGTVVKRLFEIVKPHNSYFGEKDFQQLQIIKALVKLEQMNIRIVGCPIYRELDGLAMSSRNARLTVAHRKAAPFIRETLLKAKEMFGTENAVTVLQWVTDAFEKHPLLALEYFSIADEKSLKPIVQRIDNHDYRGFVAVMAGEIRLIDNIEL